MTHCAPDIVVADLHTSTSGSASLKSDVSLGTSSSSASDSSILWMHTIVISKSSIWAVYKSGLSSTALNIVQPDLTNTISKSREQCNGIYDPIKIDIQ